MTFTFSFYFCLIATLLCISPLQANPINYKITGEHLSLFAETTENENLPVLIKAEAMKKFSLANPNATTHQILAEGHKAAEPYYQYQEQLRTGKISNLDDALGTIPALGAPGTPANSFVTALKVSGKVAHYTQRNNIKANAEVQFHAMVDIGARKLLAKNVTDIMRYYQYGDNPAFKKAFETSLSSEIGVDLQNFNSNDFPSDLHEALKRKSKAFSDLHKDLSGKDISLMDQAELLKFIEGKNKEVINQLETGMNNKVQALRKQQNENTEMILGSIDILSNELGGLTKSESAKVISRVEEIQTSIEDQIDVSTKQSTETLIRYFENRDKLRVEKDLKHKKKAAVENIVFNSLGALNPKLASQVIPVYKAYNDISDTFETIGSLSKNGFSIPDFFLAANTVSILSNLALNFGKNRTSPTDKMLQRLLVDIQSLKKMNSENFGRIHMSHKSVFVQLNKIQENINRQFEDVHIVLNQLKDGQLGLESKLRDIQNQSWNTFYQTRLNLAEINNSILSNNETKCEFNYLKLDASKSEIEYCIRYYAKLLRQEPYKDINKPKPFNSSSRHLGTHIHPTQFFPYFINELSRKGNSSINATVESMPNLNAWLQLNSKFYSILNILESRGYRPNRSTFLEIENTLSETKKINDIVKRLKAPSLSFVNTHFSDFSSFEGFEAIPNLPTSQSGLGWSGQRNSNILTVSYPADIAEVTECGFGGKLLEKVNGANLPERAPIVAYLEKKLNSKDLFEYCFEYHVNDSRFVWYKGGGKKANAIGEFFQRPVVGLHLRTKRKIDLPGIKLKRHEYIQSKYFAHKDDFKVYNYIIPRNLWRSDFNSDLCSDLGSHCKYQMHRAKRNNVPIQKTILDVPQHLLAKTHSFKAGAVNNLLRNHGLPETKKNFYSDHEMFSSISAALQSTFPGSMLAKTHISDESIELSKLEENRISINHNLDALKYALLDVISPHTLSGKIYSRISQTQEFIAMKSFFEELYYLKNMYLSSLYFQNIYHFHSSTALMSMIDMESDFLDPRGLLKSLQKLPVDKAIQETSIKLQLDFITYTTLSLSAERIEGPSYIDRFEFLYEKYINDNHIYIF